MARVVGHALAHEGAPYSLIDGRWVRLGIGVQPYGAARCSCGQMSPPLRSTTARRRWHREHKADITTL